MKVRSSITTSLRRAVLMRGTCIAIVGVLLILFGGMFIPPDRMTYWGLPLFLVGFGMITWGLLPYRRLCQIENNPRELVLSEDESSLSLFCKGKIALSIPLACIASIKYIEESNRYGVGMMLKGSPQKIEVYNTKLLCVNELGCDLFFEYFSRRAFEFIEKEISCLT